MGSVLYAAAALVTALLELVAPGGDGGGGCGVAERGPMSQLLTQLLRVQQPLDCLHNNTITAATN